MKERSSIGVWRSCMRSGLVRIFGGESNRAASFVYFLNANDGASRQNAAPREPQLVYRLLNPLGFVAFKMGRRQGGPSRTGVSGRISKAIRNRGATQPPAHFQRNLWAAASWLFFRVARSARID